MQHSDHVQLIASDIFPLKGYWADLGSGEGAFTLALAELLENEAVIYSIDKDGGRLERQKELFKRNFPYANVVFIKQDFTEPLQVPPLNGIVMANSLHYIKEQSQFLIQLKKYLKPGGRLILIEYNSDEGNQWVPYPVPFKRFQTLAANAGYKDTRFLHSVPSTFMREIYSASSLNE